MSRFLRRRPVEPASLALLVSLPLLLVLAPAAPLTAEASDADAAGEPCPEARRDSPERERACWEQAFAARDQKLNRLYQKLRSSLPAPRAGDLRENSREWIRLKTILCATAASDGREPLAGLPILDGAAPAPDNALWFACQYQITGERIQYLRQAFQTEHLEGFADSGVYSDGLGGRMLWIRTAPDRFAFSIQVVRGPTHHIGRVDGTAQIRDDGRAVFRAEYELGDERRECRLNFFLDESRQALRIAEDRGCDFFRGARAFFDGVYRRIE